MTSHCTFTGCTRPHHAHGLCVSHADQQKRGVELRPIREAGFRVCSFDGCDRGHFGHGYCKTHWSQWSRGSELSAIRPTAAKGGSAPCSVPDCDRTSSALGLCKAHWQQQRKGRQFTPIGAPLRPRKAREARPQQERALRPVSTLPRGWERKQKPAKGTSRAEHLAELGPVEPTSREVLRAALAVLIAHDALDLAGALGLSAA